MKCPSCDGKRGWGTFGACREGDMHYKQKCYTCLGEGKVWDNFAKCDECDGKGGMGTFGPCKPLDIHRKQECRGCNGRGYQRNWSQSQPQHQPQQQQHHHHHHHHQQQQQPMGGNMGMGGGMNMGMGGGMNTNMGGGMNVATSGQGVWSEGATLRLNFLRSSGRNLQCDSGTMKGRGGNGQWAQWQVKRAGNGNVRLFNAASNKFLALKDGQTTTGSGGKWTELLPMVVGNNAGQQVWVLQSVNVPAWHCGVLPSGDIKRCDQTGTGPHARFVVEVVGGQANMGMNMGGGQGMNMGMSAGPQGAGFNMGGAGMGMGAGPQGVSMQFSDGHGNNTGMGMNMGANANAGNGGGAGFSVNFGGMGMNMGMGFQ